MAKDTKQEAEENRNVMQDVELTEDQASQVKGGVDGDPDRPLVLGLVPTGEVKVPRGVVVKP
jgi:hypothetical protein